MGNSIHSLKEFYNACLERNIPFVAWKNPQGRSITTWVSLKPPLQDDTLRLMPNTFVFAPFPGQQLPYYTFQPDVVLHDFEINDFIAGVISQYRFPDKQAPLHTIEKSHAYMHNLENLIADIQQGYAEKIVLSRTETNGKAPVDVAATFMKLTEKYENAFTYLLNTGTGQRWMGATPELLLDVEGGQARTVALAGTAVASKATGQPIRWGKKEREEQEIVSRYVRKVFNDHHISAYQEQGPYTDKAGHLNHIRTDFIFPVAPVQNAMEQFIADLHPTPAVCGVPKEFALNKIMQAEAHKREYYSGFLGTVDLHGKTGLYVNLRCMKLVSDIPVLYIGGGLTRGSNARDEQEETRQKARTLLSVMEYRK